MNLNERVMAIAANLLNEDMSTDILDKIPLDDKYWLDKTYSKEDIYSLFCDLLENEGKKHCCSCHDHSLKGIYFLFLPVHSKEWTLNLFH